MSLFKAEHLEARDLGVDRLVSLSQEIMAYSQAYESTRDERAVFAFMYSKMTERLANYLATSEKSFDDPRWIVELAEAFARRFVMAMDAIDEWLKTASAAQLADPDQIYGTVPKPWADVYLAIKDEKSYVLEDMVFSMMAHISYDLPLSLLEVKMDTRNHSHVADYHRMNDVLAGTIDELQEITAQRYNRFLVFLDRLAGFYDEFLTNYGIRVARSVAWYNAQRLNDPASARDGRNTIERSTAAFISTVRHPQDGWLRLLIPLLRFLIPSRRKWPKS